MYVHSKFYSWYSECRKLSLNLSIWFIKLHTDKRSLSQEGKEKHIFFVTIL